MEQQRRLEEATRLVRRFRRLPSNRQKRQVNRFLAEQQHLNNTVHERRVKKEGGEHAFNPYSHNGSWDYLKHKRGILFPVGIKKNGELIWKTEDANFLGEWLSKNPTNPFTRGKLGSPTLPVYLYRAVLKKAGKQPGPQLPTPNHSNNSSNDEYIRFRYDGANYRDHQGRLLTDPFYTNYFH